MMFKITKIEFDFDGEDEMNENDKSAVYSETVDTLWEVNDEDELVDMISDATGWCIKSIDYIQIQS